MLDECVNNNIDYGLDMTEEERIELDKILAERKKADEEGKSHYISFEEFKRRTDEHMKKIFEDFKHERRRKQQV